MDLRPSLATSALPVLLFAFCCEAGAATLCRASGNATIVVDGVPSQASGQVGRTFPAGTVVTTGPDGEVLLQPERGIFLEVRPDSQVTVGGSDPQAAADISGRPIPVAAVTLNSGSVVTAGSDEGFAGAALQISTPSGNVSPIAAGSFFISTSSADPNDAVVSVLAGSGAGLVTTPEGVPIPIDAGLGVTLQTSGASIPRPVLLMPGGPEALRAMELLGDAPFSEAPVSASPGGGEVLSEELTGGVQDPTDTK